VKQCRSFVTMNIKMSPYDGFNEEWRDKNGC
jgi:hypothetical protein